MAIGTVTFTAIGKRTYVELLVQVAGTGLTVTITRLGVVAGETIVRAAEDSPIQGGLWQGYDWEVPQGVPLTYRAAVSDGTNTVVVEVQMTGIIDYGGDWIMPVGRAELGMPITVEKGGVGPLKQDVIRDISKVVNRPSPVVVSWGRQMPSTTIAFLTMEHGERRRFNGIMAFPIIMFAARPNFGIEEPLFLSVGQVTEERTTGHGAESSRRWAVEVQQIARPPASYAPPPPTYSWQTRKDQGMTWGEVSDSLIRWFDYGGFGGT